jgi:hypothetical protein
MAIEDSIIKLEKLILSTYDFDKYQENMKIMNTYFLYLLNSENYSKDDKILFIKKNSEVNNNYITDWLINFFTESILKLKTKEKDLIDNDYFLFRYLSNKEIIKKIMYINLQNVSFVLKKCSNYMNNILKEEDINDFIEKVNKYDHIYFKIYNQKIFIQNLEDFFEIKKTIIENDEKIISYIMNDYFFIKKENKVVISDKIKEFIFFIFNIEIDDIDINIKDPYEDVKKMIKR